jgi:hypothetical protein
MTRFPLILILIPDDPPGPVILPVDVIVRLPVTVNIPSVEPSPASRVVKGVADVIVTSAAFVEKEKQVKRKIKNKEVLHFFFLRKEVGRC